jgi:hypothetical protein
VFSVKCYFRLQKLVILLFTSSGLTLSSGIRYLEKSINSTSGIRKQDAASVFSSVYSNPNGVATAFNFLKKNFNKIANK